MSLILRPKSRPGVPSLRAWPAATAVEAIIAISGSSRDLVRDALVEVAELHDADEQDYQEQDHRHRRGLADPEPGEGRVVDIQVGHLGRVPGTSAGHHVRGVEHLE